MYRYNSRKIEFEGETILKVFEVLHTKWKVVDLS